MNPIKKLAFLLLLTALAGICMPVQGQLTPPGKKLYTLYPPLNFQGYAVDCNSYLLWQKPQTPGGTIPAGLSGYFVYRNGTMISAINGADNLTYYDYDPDPGTYTYAVTANYDLTPYGFPGQSGESPPAGPVTLAINCDFPFPLNEAWNSGNFSMYDWSFIPAQSNWIVNTLQGNPAPTAVFTGTPPVGNYEIILKSHTLYGKPFLCANMYFEFDYKLSDISTGGTEKMIPEYYLDSTWYPLTEITNQGSTGWVHQKIDISQVCRNYFKIGFKVSGQNSANIGNWQVDNIYVYPLCKAPENTGYTLNWNQVHLFWQHPACDSLQAVAGYNVYRSDVNGQPPFTKANPAIITGYGFTDIIPTTITNAVFKYFITDLQLNYIDNTVLCEAQGDTIAVDYALGIKETGIPGTRLYPQPANDHLVISSDSPVEFCEMFDVLGTLVYKGNPGKQPEFTIPVSAFPSGIYLVSIKNASGTFVRKVSVMH